MQPYVLVLYYSRYGSVAKMAQQIARGVEAIRGIEACIRTVPEVSTICESSAAKIPTQGPPYARIEEVSNCSGLILGSPARFGNIAAPLKYFIEQLSGLWCSGELANKPAGVFCSTSGLHSGQETTLTSMMLPLLHFGMLITGISPTEPDLATTQTGGTPYGPTHMAGKDNQNPFSDEEKRLCQSLGKRVASIALKLI